MESDVLSVGVGKHARMRLSVLRFAEGTSRRVCCALQRQVVQCNASARKSPTFSLSLALELSLNIPRGCKIGSAIKS